jgi:FAD/FMN-containing dehydrogenase
MNGSAPAASIDALANGFAADLFTTDPEWMESYARDRTESYYGLPFAVARPRTVDEVAAVVRRCIDLNLGVVPQGGLTGLVGAAVSDANEPEVVMLLDRMNAVRSVDPAGYVMVVDAGCILEVAKQAAEAENCLLPITFGSRVRRGSAAMSPPMRGASMYCATA